MLIHTVPPDVALVLASSISLAIGLLIGRLPDRKVMPDESPRSL